MNFLSSKYLHFNPVFKALRTGLMSVMEHELIKWIPPMSCAVILSHAGLALASYVPALNVATHGEPDH